MAKKHDQIEKKSLRTACTIIAVVLSFVGGMATCWYSLEPEFRSLIKTKMVIDEFYYEEVDDDKFFGTIFDAINNEILDDYSYYMTADELQAYESQGEGKHIGVGLMFTAVLTEGNEQMRILRVCGNSPAEAAGIKNGSYLVGFGDSEETIVDSENFNEFSAFIDKYGEGEAFYLKLKEGSAEDAPTRLVSISKQAYVESYVSYRTATTAYRFEGNDALTMVQKGEALTCLDEKTAYIQFTEFNGAAAGEFSQVMKQFRKDGMKNLVLDLRGNGGGYLDILSDIASYFCKNATSKRPMIVSAKYKDYTDKFYANGNYYWDYFAEDSRICVLADVNTASASECLLGAMLDYGTIAYSDICLPERYGMTKTYGKGIMQTTLPLLSGDAVKLTTAQIRWPISNNCIHDRGILPEDGTLSLAEMDDFEEELVACIAKLFA